MKIAQVSPLYESVPPQLYGGTERIVSYLTEALVDLGHEVTLFASGDSETRARLIPACPRALRLNSQAVDHMAPHMGLLDLIHRHAADFDLIHFHIDYLHFSSSRYLPVPHLTTLHGRLDLPELSEMYDHYLDMPVVSISDHQRLPLPRVNWQSTVAHGLPETLYREHGESGDYLAFLGRISPEKGVEQAIEIAKLSGIKLIIAAKVDKADQVYFDTVVEPLINAYSDSVEYIGEITDAMKNDFLGKAKCLVFPINWPEPFGLVMIEAMACGTPVIAFNRGSVPEVMEDGVTGYVVNSVPEAVKAIAKIDAVSRAQCRRVFENRFSNSRMAKDYVAIYQRLITASKSPRPLRHAGFDPSQVPLVAPNFLTNVRAERPNTAHWAQPNS